MARAILTRDGRPALRQCPEIAFGHALPHRGATVNDAPAAGLSLRGINRRSDDQGSDKSKRSPHGNLYELNSNGW